MKEKERNYGERGIQAAAEKEKTPLYPKQVFTKIPWISKENPSLAEAVSSQIQKQKAVTEKEWLTKEVIDIEFLDFFAGIGLFRLGMEQADFVCRGHCEIDKHALLSYQAMHGRKEGEWFEKDITQINPQSLPDVDVWTAGFPCQDCSIAGSRQGLLGARSGLFFELIRLLQGREPDHRPRWIVLENVKGILSSNATTDFGIILYELASLGYGVEYALLNSKDFGVPQNRERVFFVCDLTGRSTGKILCFGGKNEKTLEQMVGGGQGCRVYSTDGLAPTITSGSGGLGAKTGLFLMNAGNDPAHQKKTGVLEECSRPRAVLAPDRLNKRQNCRRFKDEEEEMFTLTTVDRHGILQNARIRRLTPRECFRLQGVPDEYFDRAAKVCSDTQLYKQAGNAVTVPVVAAIGKRIQEWAEQENKK